MRDYVIFVIIDYEDYNSEINVFILILSFFLRSIKQSSKKSVGVTSYNNDAYVSNSYHITSEGQVTEIKTLSFKPYEVK